MGSLWIRKIIPLIIFLIALVTIPITQASANPDIKIGLAVRQTSANISINKGMYFLEIPLSQESALLNESDRLTIQINHRSQPTFSVVVGPFVRLGLFPFENEEGALKALIKINNLGFLGNIIAFTSIPTYVIEIGRFQDILEAEIFRLQLEAHFSGPVILPTLRNGVLIRHPEFEIFYPTFDSVPLSKIINIRPFGSGLLNYGTRTYRGSLGIFWSPSQEDFQVINELPIEDYLLGVVPSEMPDSFNIEALKAQAIAARTYALRNFGRFRRKGFDLCDTSISQVYRGFTAERPNSTQALIDTYGMVLHHNGDLAHTFYHSTSGGRTENVENVWGGLPIPYLVAVDSPFETASPHFTWVRNLTLPQITDMINRLLVSRGLSSVGNIRDIQVLRRGQSPRILTARIIGDRGNADVSGGFIRSALSLRETWAFFEFDGGPGRKVFTINASNNVVESRLGDLLDFSSIGNNQSIVIKGRESQENIPVRWQNVTVSGRGWGHGVGMSQWGAQGLAQNGWNFERILQHFYPGTIVTKIY
ncbi:MAG: Amidase enhancer [candidate division WS2 bacterium]|nr:Amidase enhancer [Candidatus Psychracetigena formicireducens]